jgi:hypothetical protein
VSLPPRRRVRNFGGECLNIESARKRPFEDIEGIDVEDSGFGVMLLSKFTEENSVNMAVVDEKRKT